MVRTPKALASMRATKKSDHGDVRPPGLMVVYHPPRVHPVNVVSAKNGHIPRIDPPDEVQALVHSVGGTPVPDLAALDVLHQGWPTACRPKLASPIV